MHLIPLHANNQWLQTFHLGHATSFGAWSKMEASKIGRLRPLQAAAPAPSNASSETIALLTVPRDLAVVADGPPPLPHDARNPPGPSR